MDYARGMMGEFKGEIMSNNSCTYCVKFLNCHERIGRWNDKQGIYEPCDELEVDDNLEGRIAKCTDCGERQPSKPSLPFFWYRPDKMHDSYYCGCRGWD